MKIGVFLNYDPYTVLYKEGLGKYLASQVNGYINTGNDVTILCPKWLKKSLKQLFDDNRIDYSRIIVVTPRYIPPIWDIYSKIVLNKKTRKTSITDYLKKQIGARLQSFAKITSPLNFSINAIVTMLEGLILFLLFIPIFGLGKLILLVLRFFKNKCQYFTNICGINSSFNKMFQIMLDESADELVKIANRHKEIDVWYVPGLFWPQVNKIEGPTVINMPDIETEVFAEGFSSEGAAFTTNRLRQTIAEGQYFITYSEYVADKLVREQQAGKNKWVVSIPQDNHNLLTELKFADEVIDIFSGFNNDYSIDKFAEFIVDGLGKFRYSHLSNVKYIFFASQYRANKNFITFIKAYDYMIHKCFRKEKLVITADVYSNSEVRNYIEEYNLVNDIIVCKNVSSQQLAALYCCAKLVVNPTLYEGGFPFTFGEGMSVRTPSVMSDIPQVRNILEKYHLESIMFDPYDYIKMAEKICWGLDNAEYLYEIELPLYLELEKRTPEFVAKEYVEVFRRILLLQDCKK